MKKIDLYVKHCYLSQDEGQRKINLQDKLTVYAQAKKGGKH